MERIRIYLVEDEIIMTETIIDMLEDLDYEVIGNAITAEYGLVEIEKCKPEIALLDINLRGEKDGIWLGNQIKKTINIPFIYLTSFADKETIMNATKSFPYGYLLKPIEKQNLFAGIEVALKKFSEENSIGVEDSLEEDAAFVNNSFVIVKDEYVYKKVSVFEILFVKANGNYIEIYTAEKKHMIKGTLKKFKDNLPESHFFQPHRSYIISLQKIESFSANSVKIQNHEIPIVKTQKDELQSILKTYSFSD
jgi:DNA-binding LytR/AlgR family response regulator